MHKSLYILAILITLGAVFLLARTFLTPHETPVPGTGTQTPFGEPIDTQGSGGSQSGSAHGTPASGATMTVTAQDNSVLSIKNIFKDPDTAADPSNQGQYYIGYHPFDMGSTTAQQNAPFYINYIASTNYFGIMLNQEPIAQTRQQAEQYLMQKLGLTQDQMCKLRYTVSVPNFVNQTYAGDSLGFSFCPGAVNLPL